MAGVEGNCREEKEPDGGQGEGAAAIAPAPVAAAATATAATTLSTTEVMVEKAANRKKEVLGKQSMQECNICEICKKPPPPKKDQAAAKKRRGFIEREHLAWFAKFDSSDRRGFLKFRVKLADKMKIRAVAFLPGGRVKKDGKKVTSLITACDQGYLYHWKYGHNAKCTESPVDSGKLVFELQQVFHSGKMLRVQIIG